eukprot:gene2000-2275_t
MHLRRNNELVTLGSFNCASEQVVLGIRSIDDIGQRQYEKEISMESDVFALVERFVCVVYERCTEAVKILVTGVGFSKMNAGDPAGPTYQMQVKQFL